MHVKTGNWKGMGASHCFVWTGAGEIEVKKNWSGLNAKAARVASVFSKKGISQSS